jgi:hypothetical protein
MVHVGIGHIGRSDGVRVRWVQNLAPHALHLKDMTCMRGLDPHTALTQNAQIVECRTHLPFGSWVCGEVSLHVKTDFVNVARGPKPLDCIRYAAQVVPVHVRDHYER